ncbi:hypothetical protein SAMN05443245_7618 [Paraburkholderia fungorum]|uniref:Uncharacterized protein n=2 Tax=Paraburkholderia fungorum TaxID=134537 RepID=A0A1H1JYZ0_9BURK|nr:hypothetical protein SAMN05443245_7618 [Paraburkholderia fungorum]
MQANGANPKLDDAKRAMLTALSTIDHKGSYISPLVSIIEGEKGRFDTAEEKAECLEAETAAVRKFFKAATLDSDYLKANESLASLVFTQHREGFGTQREIFFRQARGLLVEIAKKVERKRIQEQLITIATSVGLALNDPILVFSIACLHQNDCARDVLKPRDDSIFNALNDVHLVSRISAVMAVGLAHDSSLSFGFLTGDIGLREVLRFVQFGTPKISEDGTVFTELKYSADLYRGLGQDERELLKNRLELPAPFDSDNLEPAHTYESITAGTEAACHESMGIAAQLAAAGKMQEWAMQRAVASGLIISWQWLTKDSVSRATWKVDRQRLDAIVFPESSMSREAQTRHP